MLPYILLSLPLALLSRALSANELSIFLALNILMFGWVGILLFKQVMETNNYRFGETVELILLSLFGIVICWAVLLTLYVLVRNVWNFGGELLMDIRVLLQPR